MVDQRRHHEEQRDGERRVQRRDQRRRERRGRTEHRGRQRDAHVADVAPAGDEPHGVGLPAPDPRRQRHPDAEQVGHQQHPDRDRERHERDARREVGRGDGTEDQRRERQVVDQVVERGRGPFPEALGARQHGADEDQGEDRTDLSQQGRERHGRHCAGSSTDQTRSVGNDSLSRRREPWVLLV
jgi:hypothetical protein